MSHFFHFPQERGEVKSDQVIKKIHNKKKYFFVSSHNLLQNIKTRYEYAFYYEQLHQLSY